jgi:hypothetical protein
MGVSHSVFLKFKEGAPADAIQEFMDRLDEFPANKPGIRRWISGRTGPYYPIASDRFSHAFICEVDSPAAMVDYARHPFHRVAASLMGPIVEEVLVLDFEFKAVQQSAVFNAAPRAGDPDVAVAHVVMLGFKPDAAPEDVERFTRALDQFPREKPSIRRWTLGKTGPFYPSATDQYQLAFVAEVDSIAAMEMYAKHPYHTQVVSPLLMPIMEKVLVVDIAYSRVLQSAHDYFQVVPYR